MTIRNAGINPTRTGLLDALLNMGADITVTNEREVCGEPVGDLVVRHAPLKGITIGPDVALRAIDEIPVLSVAAAFAQGNTKITGIRELRTKESDRVAAIERLLGAAGIAVDVAANGLVIAGGSPKGTGAIVDTHDDHRIAMATAALAAGAGTVAVDSDASIEVSFPSVCSNATECTTRVNQQPVYTTHEFAAEARYIDTLIWRSPCNREGQQSATLRLRAGRRICASRH